MLTSMLQEVLNKLQAKSSRTDKENRLLQELQALDELLVKKSASIELRESVKSHTQITSGPGSCPCCGR